MYKGKEKKRKANINTGHFSLPREPQISSTAFLVYLNRDARNTEENGTYKQY
jgi:hypothetical protein